LVAPIDVKNLPESTSLTAGRQAQAQVGYREKRKACLSVLFILKHSRGDHAWFFSPSVEENRDGENAQGDQFESDLSIASTIAATK
jgi:hypothetical protein